MTGLFRCRICGEVYFGTHPSHCPHCGAHKKFMIKISAWKEENKGVKLSEKSKANIEETRDLEYSATRFYKGVAKETDSALIYGFFKYLARTELEHYEVACKLLGEEVDQTVKDPSDGEGSDMANLEKSKKLEEHVTGLYKRFGDEAEEPRVKEFFYALSEVEADHIELDKEEIDNLSKS